MDKSEDLFKDFGPAIVGNIIDYSSSTNEDQVEKEKKKEDTFSQKKLGDVLASTEVATTSAPIATVTVTPSTPPTQVAVVTIVVQLDDEVKAQNLISSLRKLYEIRKL